VDDVFPVGDDGDADGEPTATLPQDKRLVAHGNLLFSIRDVRKRCATR